MCFSTEASFISGAVLSIIGIATIKKAQTPAQIIFAVIPLLFAVQQIAEALFGYHFPMLHLDHGINFSPIYFYFSHK